MKGKNLYKIFTATVFLVLLIQSYFYLSSYLVKLRFKQLGSEFKSSPQEMFFKQRSLKWSPGYTITIERNIPEGSKILFIKNVEIEGTVGVKKYYLYHYLQTYINKQYVFFYEMFYHPNGKEGVVKYMKENHFDFWVTFVETETDKGNRYQMKIYKLEGGELKLVDMYG